MENKARLIAESQVYFDRYPEIDAFYATSDGQFFFYQPLADAHQRSLKIEGLTEAMKLSRNDFEKQSAAEKATKTKKAAQAKKPQVHKKA